jgi:hypothetical protein
MALNATVFTPMPMARVRTASPENPGREASARTANRRSVRSASILIQGRSRNEKVQAAAPLRAIEGCGKLGKPVADDVGRGAEAETEVLRRFEEPPWNDRRAPFRQQAMGER